MFSKKRKTISLILTLVILLSMSASAADLTTAFDESAKVASALEEDLAGIIITQVPLEYKAVLSNGLRKLTAGDAVLSSQFESLTLTPKIEADVTASVGYIPVYSDGSLGDEEFFDVGIFSKKNSPPVAENVSSTTYKNIAITGELKAVDPDGDELTFEITGRAKRGEAVINEDGTFTYTPNKNKVGKDSFTYTATDSKGNASAPAQVEIEITKPTSKLTYTDMAGDTACYAAMRLNEEGVFTGEKLAGEYFFRPNQLVTRGEFLAAIMSLTDTEIEDARITAGFADDDITPAWVRPYITTALQNGIISGVATTEGQLVFRSEAYLTKAEAAVIINNALDLKGGQKVMASMAEVPAWAYQAASNLESAGILSADDEGSYRLTDNMTRAEMAVMLSDMMDIMNKQDAGLLAWVFD